MALRIVLAAGDFGSGKTTLVRRLMRQAAAAGDRASALVCEPEVHRYDSECLQNEPVPARRMATPAGAPGLERWAQILGDFSGAPGESWCFVELPGGMEPGRFLRSGVLPSHAAIHTIALVDAQSAHGRAALEDPRTYGWGAELLLLNKLDAVPEDVPARMLAQARRHAPAARAIATVESTVTLDEIRDSPSVPPARLPAEQRSPEILHYGWIALPSPLRRGDVDLFLSDPPSGALRIKGCIGIEGSPHYYHLQITGRSGALRRNFLESPPSTGLCWVSTQPTLGGWGMGLVERRSGRPA
jgi:G3E family GTPase